MRNRNPLMSQKPPRPARVGKPKRISVGKVAKVLRKIARRDHEDDEVAGAIPPGEQPYQGRYENREHAEAKPVARRSGDAFVADGGGLRKDDGKNKLELIPPEWIWGLGQVLTQGAEKYLMRNWERGMSWGKMVGCGLRHVFKFVCGERYDRESGCHHLLHASWNFLSLMSYDLRGIGDNDLPSFNTAGLRVMLLVCDPNHPRTKKLLADEEKRVVESHARYAPEPRPLKPMKAECRHSLTTVGRPGAPNQQINECYFCHGEEPVFEK